jgi:hypothetical protein
MKIRAFDRKERRRKVTVPRRSRQGMGCLVFTIVPVAKFHAH